MKKYGMYLKNGKDLIHLIHQQNKEQATQYFVKTKRLPIKEFNEIFTVKEIKRKKNERVLHKRTNRSCCQIKGI